MTIAELRIRGIKYVGLAALIARYYQSDHLFTAAINAVVTGRPMPVGPPFGSVAWCATVPLNSDGIPHYTTSVRPEFVTWVHSLEQSDVNLYIDSIRLGVTTSGPTGIVRFPEIYQERTRIDRDYWRARANQAALANPVATTTYGLGAARAAALIRMTGMLAIAQADATGNVRPPGNCWTYIDTLFVRAGGASKGWVTIAVPAIASIAGIVMPPGACPTFPIECFRYPGIGNQIVAVGALVVFQERLGTTLGHWALYSGNNRCVGSNFPTGSGVREVPITNLERQYETVTAYLMN